MFGIRFLKLLKVLLIIYLNNNLLFVNAAHKSNWKRFSGELLRVASVNVYLKSKICLLKVQKYNLFLFLVSSNNGNNQEPGRCCYLFWNSDSNC